MAGSSGRNIWLSSSSYIGIMAYKRLSQNALALVGYMALEKPLNIHYSCRNNVGKWVCASLSGRIGSLRVAKKSV
jgi:hypothetical protein